MAPVFSYFVRSLELKCEARSSEAHYLQAQPATPRAMRPLRCPRARRPLQKGFLSAGKLTDTATGIAVDEKQLISWARTNRPKKWRRPTCQFRSWSSKSQEAKMMHDLLQPTEIVLRRLSSAACLYVRLDRGSKAWVNSQDLLPFAIFTRRLLSRDCDRRRNCPRTERRQKLSDAKSKKSVQSALQNTVGRVSRSRDLFLFGPR